MAGALDSQSLDSQSLGSTDIAIIGGGMVGISLALLLARANPQWQLTLIESHALGQASPGVYQSSFDARSTALSAGAKPILQMAGVWQQLCGQLSPIRRVHVSDKGHFGGATMDAADHQLEAVGYVAENAWLGQVLAQALNQQANIECLAPAQVESLRPSAQGYHIHFTGSDRPPLQSTLVVIADGVRSRLAQQLGIGFEQRDYHQSALIANVSLERSHGGVAYERFTDQGPVALLPLNDADNHKADQSQRMALVWTLPAREVEQIAALDDASFLSELQQRFGFRAGRFTHVGEKHSYPLQRVLAQEQVRRGLVLMGNAAHFLHPVAGQGFNLALRDCRALVETLCDAPTPQSLGDLSLLQTYLQCQQQDQALTIGMSDQLVRWFSSDALPKSLLRNMGLLGLDFIPGAGALFARRAMGVG